MLFHRKCRKKSLHFAPRKSSTTMTLIRGRHYLPACLPTYQQPTCISTNNSITNTTCYMTYKESNFAYSIAIIAGLTTGHLPSAINHFTQRHSTIRQFMASPYKIDDITQTTSTITHCPTTINARRQRHPIVGYYKKTK